MENKEKNPQINRAAYLIILSLLAVLAVLAIATSSANRARKEGTETQPPAVTTEPLRTTPPAGTKDPLHTATPDTTDTPATTAAPAPITTAPESTKAPETQTSAPVDATPLKLLLPVSGQLLQGHDLEVPAWSDTMADYRTHCGMDIAAQMGASVCAAADGVIAQVWEDPMMGQCIAVQHGGDAVSIYKNLALEMAEGIEAGAKVGSGQLLGYVGESAMTELADEPHLHFELTVAGLQVDPLEYMDKEAVATLSSSAYEDSAKS